MLARSGPSSPASIAMHDSKASMYSLNNSGLSGQPCFTPIVHGNVLERPSVVCDMHAWSWLYMDRKHARKRPPTPMPSNIRHSFSRSMPSTSLAGAGTTRSGGEEGGPSSGAKPCRSASFPMPCAASFYARYRLQNLAGSTLAILHKRIPLNLS
ncbi:unnamed protein product [Sphagnum jensenii]|uniref:Uncharacterized protein n=1 Tax=Sphagnum jensenii TaxID=128206 RepID=A0ABP1BSF0_9BRYO